MGFSGKEIWGRLFCSFKGGMGGLSVMFLCVGKKSSLRRFCIAQIKHI